MLATFRVGEKTHQAVLPQRPALESVSVDKPGIRHETGHGRCEASGAGHGRGEIIGGSPAPGGVTPRATVIALG